MVDYDHRQWLEDEEERKAMHKPHAHLHADNPASADAEEAPPRRRLDDEARDTLRDWNSDPIS